jgi:hypothetical protein
VATRVPPGPLNLAFGQALSGANTTPSTREDGRQALMAVLGGGVPATAPVLSASSAATLDAVSESAAESRRSADLVALQQRLADFAEADRRRRLADATEVREGREAAQRQRERLVAEGARQAEERRLTAERREQSRRAEQALRDTGATDARRAQRPLDDAPDASTLVAIEQRLQRKVEAVQRALNTLSEDLTEVRQMFAKKTPAPTGNEEAPFREGERRLDLGEDP